MKEHYKALDSLRGIWCVIVAFVHWPSGGVLMSPGFNISGMLVDLFFVMSGFLIASHYAERITDRRSMVRFGWLRIGRIYPLHALALLFMVGLELVSFIVDYATTGARGDSFTGARVVSGIFTNLLFIHQFGIHPGATWNAPSWSVATEMWVYLVFAVVTLFAGKLKYPIYGLLAVLCWIVLHHWSQQGLYPTMQLAVFRGGMGFFIGTLLWRFMQWLDARPAGKPLPTAVWTAIEVVLMPIPVFLTLFAGNTSPAAQAAPIVTAITIMVFALEKGAVSRLLQNPKLVYFGILSFSIYMIHWPLIVVVWGVVHALEAVTGMSLHHVGHTGIPYLGSTPLAGDLWFIVFIIGVSVLAHMSYTYFEEPCRKAFKRSRVGVHKRAAAVDAGELVIAKAAA